MDVIEAWERYENTEVEMNISFCIAFLLIELCRMKCCDGGYKGIYYIVSRH